MAKTYAPQMARLLQHVVKYEVKHASKIQAAATAQQWTDLQTVISAINNSWISVQTIEQP